MCGFRKPTFASTENSRECVDAIFAAGTAAGTVALGIFVLAAGSTLLFPIFYRFVVIAVLLVFFLAFLVSHFVVAIIIDDLSLASFDTVLFWSGRIGS